MGGKQVNGSAQCAHSTMPQVSVDGAMISLQILFESVLRFSAGLAEGRANSTTFQSLSTPTDIGFDASCA